MMAMWKLYGYGDWKCSPKAVITLHYRCVQEDSTSRPLQQTCIVRV